MIRNIIILLIFTTTYCRSDEKLHENMEEDGNLSSSDGQEALKNEGVLTTADVEQKADNTQKPDILQKMDVASYIEETIAIIESDAKKANRVIREGILPLEETEKYYNDIVDLIEDLMEILMEPTRAYIFLKDKGIERVIIPNISVNNAKLRVVTLKLLKVLFEQMPTTTEAVIPVSVIDKLVDIFENDDYLGTKAHALDILHLWLPGNPKAQVRVIKMKGLEPFYQPVSDLSGGVISKLLDLFNIILEEHIRVRTEMKQRRTDDSDKYIIYQRMGLLEHLSTSQVCDGLLNIFSTIFSHTKDYDMTAPVYKLIKNVKPYCTKAQIGKEKAIKFFESILDHVQNHGEADLERYDLNVTDIKTVLEDYIEGIKKKHLVKDEF